MPSIVQGYEYDIFISYRQNDNAGGWVTDFTKSLKEELASTIKDSLSLYFDASPVDGLLETHHVDKSLEGKLRCLIFIPVISQTYCDAKCFAWQNEFQTFNRISQQDSLGRDIKLASGNTASRILPVQIHELEHEDRQLIESEISGAVRSVEFIYKTSGVNRPLTVSDNPDKNLNKTFYRDQVNKVANAVKELVYAIKYPGRISITSARQEHPNTETGVAGNAKSAASDNSIAVMPFVNLSQDATQEYFADGVMENILIQLAGLKHLRVTSRTSVMRYKKASRSVPEIADELAVRYILEGSAQAHAGKVRIQVQLIDSQSDQPIWGKVFVESLDDIFVIQNNVAEIVARELNASLLPKEGARLKQVPTKNLKAFDLFLKGRHAFNQWNLEGYRTAEKYFKQALSEDPEFAPAYSYLASTYSALMSWNGDLSPAESVARINQYLPQAIKRGATDNDYLTQAFIEFFVNKDFQAAEQRLQKAMEAGPNNADVLYTYSYVLSMMGRMNEALETVAKAKVLDPTSVSSFNYQAIALYLLGRYDEARHILEEASLLYPHVLRLYDHLARVHLTKGAFAEAVDVVNDGLKKVAQRPPSMLAYQAAAYVGMGKNEEADKLLNELLERSSKSEKGVNLYIAHVYRAKGNLTSTIEYLNKARAANDIDLVWLKVDPLLKSVSGDNSSGAPDYDAAERYIREKLKNELPPLPYHNTAHIQDVLDAALTIAATESLSEEEKNLVRIAALFHDAGIIISHRQHEEKGCEIARQILPSFGFTNNQIEIICGMILATKIPQSPQTLLERILCDADLDYLGRTDFYEIGGRLNEELKAAGLIETEREWNLIQKTFLESHRYHTNFARSNREALKNQHLSEVIQKLKK